MLYSDFLKRWEEINQTVAIVVQQLEKCFKSGLSPIEISNSGDLPFNDLEWQGFCLNTYKLLGVSRMRGGPYSTHPTRMAYFLSEALKNSEFREKSVLYALFHDYLEEGDGRNTTGIQNFTEVFGDYPDVVKASIFLSEPQIPFAPIQGKIRHLDVVSYIIQILLLKNYNNFEALTNTSIMDKIDNLHDLSYIIKNKKLDQGKVHDRLCEKIGIFQFIDDKIGHKCDTILSGLLKEALIVKTRDLGLDKTVVDSYYKTLNNLFDENRILFEQKILKYHKSIGIEI